MFVRADFKLPELAEAAGISPRMVRYYVQRGLTPAPVFRGPDTSYAPEHLLRLKAIKRLQDQQLPLEQIQIELSRLTEAELHRLVDNGTWRGPTTNHQPQTTNPVRPK